MIFNFTKEDHEKVIKLLDTKELNISSVELYIDYLNNHFNDIDKELINKYRSKYSLNESFYKAFLEVEELDDTNEDFIALINNSKISKMDSLNLSDYLNDPYLKLIRGLNYKEGDWLLTSLEYKPFEGFVYNEIEVNNTYFEEHTPFGFFEKGYRYPALLEKDEIWMSLNPHEINTMKEPIKHAHGDVLVFGLGLGYYTYMASLKKDVKSVTVIEKDKRAIDIFNKVILPKINTRNKIRVINDDCFNYLKINHHFDYAFIDIWHNVHDGLPLYLKLKGLEKDNTTYDYWIETSLIAMLRRQILTLYEEKIYEKYTDDDYLKASNENDKIINKLYFYLKDYQFGSYSEFHDLLKDENLIKLAKHLKY